MDLELITDIEGREYLFMLEILTGSFPKEEYRDLPEIKRLIKEEDAFRPTIIRTPDGRCCGIMNHWTFDGFVYVEHFAIREDLRNRGLGKEALRAFLETLEAPTVLEVELPTGDMERRRIAFYERSGFEVIKGRYFQPPYRSGDKPLEMLIMAHRAKGSPMPSLERIKKSIYHRVYQTSEDMPYPVEHTPTS